MKKVIGAILGIIFVVAVVCGVVVGTYVFKQPSREGDSRAFINGPWYTEAEDGKGIVFDFDQSGEFTAHYYNDKKDYKNEKEKYDDYDEEDIITKGYFKVDEDKKKIKLLILPDYLDQTDIDFEYNLKFFTTIKYSDLEFQMAKKHSDKKQDVPDATTNLIIGKTSYPVTQSPDDLDVYKSKKIEW